ncbi:MAG: TonB family protein [Sandaracinaceae bacterium]|nr:TonB family protein [Sandaracinaceae bacterium]
MTSLVQTAGVLTASLLMHGLAFLAIGALPQVVVLPEERNEVAFEVVEAPPPEPEPLPETPPAPEPEAPRPVAREMPAREAPEEPPPETPPPPAAPLEEEIVNFDGTTLTNDNADPSFTMNAGNGQRMTGPLRSGNSTRRVEGDPNGMAGGTGTAPAAAGPTIVPVSDLSRRPTPPSMDRMIATLARNYPRDARDEGIAGTAVARMQISPDGRLSRIRIVSGNEHGFGDACRRSLQEMGAWSPPLDRNGQPVTTEVTFECGFTINDF